MNAGAVGKVIEDTKEAEFPELDPSVLRSGTPPPQLPTDLLGSFWPDLIEKEANAKSVPADYVTASVLTGAASLLGSARCSSPWESWIEIPVMWMALVGSPSSGKSPAMDTIVRAVADLENEINLDFSDRLRQYEAQREFSKQIKEGWQADVTIAVAEGRPPPDPPEDAVAPSKPQRRRLSIGDATPEKIGELLAENPKGLLVRRDELAGLIGGFDRYTGANAERSFWMEAYGSRPYTIDRKNLDEPTCIPHLTLSILGCIQPDVLKEKLLKGDDDGLAARFLYVWPSKVSVNRPTAFADYPAALGAFRRLEALRLHMPSGSLTPQPCVVTFDDAAVDHFVEWRRGHCEAEPEGRYASWWGKMPGTVVRLALILEYLWWSGKPEAPEPSNVSAAAVSSATKLVDEYFIPMAERAYGEASLPSDLRDAATLARWILKEKVDRLNVREICRNAKLPNLSAARNVEDALAVLEEANWVFPDSQRDGSSPGRKKKDFYVNPRFLEFVD